MCLPDEDGLYLEIERGRVVRIVVGGFQHGEDDVLDGGDVVPRFSCDVRRIFDRNWKA